MTATLSTVDGSRVRPVVGLTGAASSKGITPPPNVGSPNSVSSACDRVCTNRPNPSENWTETSTSAVAPGSVSWCTRRTVRTETGSPRSRNAPRS